MDGRHLTFAGHLGGRHGVADLPSSVRRLKACVRACTAPILFLGHNGPAGFGSGRHDPWSLPLMGRDNGDPDLAEVIAWASEQGHPVLGVIAGHRHRRDGDTWRVERDGIVYINAARYPRIFERDGSSFHAWIRLRTDGKQLHAEEISAALP